MSKEMKLLQRSPQPGLKLSKEDAMKKWEAQLEKDYEPVTGVFENKEKPGQKLSLWWGKDGTLKQYTFEEGKRYKIPRALAKHLNQNCYYPEYQHLSGKLADVGASMAVQPETALSGHEDTFKNMYAIKKHYRASFRSLEYMDDDINAPHVQEVVYV